MPSSPSLIPPTPTADEYAADTLARPPVPDTDDPFALFALWLADARASEPNDPNAMALATVDADGLPDVRVVLLKDVDARGFTFYTNTLSAKGRELAANPVCALNFHWKSLRRQVRVRGAVEQVTPQEADAYFHSRARESQLGACASAQSSPLDSLDALRARMDAIEARHAGATIPRPAHWSGYRVQPLAMEFWQDRPFRLHDRLQFRREGEGWTRQRLQP